MNQRCKKHGAVLNGHIAKVIANFIKLVSSIRNHQSFMQLLSMENSCVGEVDLTPTKTFPNQFNCLHCHILLSM